MKILILLDVNKTIMMADPAGGKSMDDVFLASIAEDPQYAFCWEPMVITPVTFKQYVDEYVYPGKKSDGRLKNMRKTAIGEVLAVMDKTNHPLADKARRRIQTAKEILKQAHQDTIAKHANRSLEEDPPALLIPSFYHLVRWLEEEKGHHGLHYKIVIRTFGTDIPEVLSAIKLNTPLSFEPGHFFKGAYYHGPKSENSLLDGTSLSLAQTYLHWTTSLSHLAVQDDWAYWNQHSELGEYGKPFPYNSQDEWVSVFFDDNIETHGPSNIIAPFDIASKTHTSIESALSEKRAVIVDPLKALEDRDYFVDKIKQSMQLQAEKRAPLIFSEVEKQPEAKDESYLVDTPFENDECLDVTDAKLVKYSSFMV